MHTQKNKTKLLEIISSEIYKDSLIEINNNINRFDAHSPNEDYKNSGALKECRTLYLTQSVNPKLISQGLPLSKIADKFFPNTISLFNFLSKKITSNAKLGRSYITILPPGKQIYEHADVTSKYFFDVDRYQFYYTGNTESHKIIDNTLFEVNPGYFYFFDHKRVHKYFNHSNENLIFMVFDLFK